VGIVRVGENGTPIARAWLDGSGTAVVAKGRCEVKDAAGVTRCCPASGPSGIDQARAVAKDVPELTFAGGAMHARLMLDDRSVSPEVYMGSLAGTAPVAEHQHDASWEILCAVEAAGTFVLGGKERRLGAHECVSVPPATKHSWRPEPGTTLVAVQMYVPAGPEQRFKGIAAAPASSR